MEYKYKIKNNPFYPPAEEEWCWEHLGQHLYLYHIVDDSHAYGVIYDICNGCKKMVPIEVLEEVMNYTHWWYTEGCKLK